MSIKSFWSINRVSVRIGIGFGVLLVLILCCAGTGYYSLMQLGSISRFISGPAWSNADGIMNGVIQTQDQMLAVNRLVMSGNSPSLLERIQSQGVGADESFAEVHEQGLVAKEKLATLNHLRGEYKNAMSQLLKQPESSELLKSFTRSGEVLLTYIEELESEGDAIVDDASQKVAPLQSRMSMLILVFAFSSVVVSIVAATVTARSVVRPVDEVVDALQRFGNGELGQRIHVTRSDEFGDMAIAFNSAASKIHTLMIQVRGSSHALAASAHQIRSNADSISHGVQSTTEQTGRVNSVAFELAQSMTNADQSASEMTTNVDSISSSLREMTSTINEISAVTQKYTNDVTTTSELATTTNNRVHYLLEATNAIGNVVQLIEDLAEQTNLLALNATIEAARAGESGKGFAVVATEVKELAKQTAGATADIRKSIETVQTASKEAVVSIDSINVKIRGMNETTSKIAAAIEEQSISTRNMADHMASASNSVSTVAGSVRISTKASRQITQSIEEVNRVAKGTADGAVQFVDAGKRLQIISEELDTLVGQFQL